MKSLVTALGFGAFLLGAGFVLDTGMQKAGLGDAAVACAAGPDCSTQPVAKQRRSLAEQWSAWSQVPARLAASL